MQWFRMYAEAVDDDKLRLLAFEDRWHFVALLCLKSGGVLDSDPATLERRVSIKLGVVPADLAEVKRRLKEVGLIGDDWQPTGWRKRQFESDKSTERTRKWRKNQKRFRNVTATSQERSSDVSETSQRRHGDGPDTEQNRTDTEQIPSLRSGKTRKGKAHFVPDDFVLTPERRTWTETENSSLDVDVEFARFRDHEFKQAHSDWDRAWRRWVRTGKQRGDFAKRTTGAPMMFGGKPVEWQ